MDRTNAPSPVVSAAESASLADKASRLRRLSAIEDRIFTARRLQFYGTGVVVGMAIAFMVGWASYRVPAVIRPDGKFDSIDFCLIWASGRFAAISDPSRIYDYPTFAAAYDIFYRPEECRPLLQGYIYPPTYLFFTYLVGLMPYLTAFTVWMAATLALYLAAVYAIVPRPLALIAAMAPAAAFKNLQLGYNGFLTAGLFGLSLVFLERRPWLSGIFLGLLTYKPQFGVLFPLVLMASRNSRALASAAATSLAFGATAAFAFGGQTWSAFIASLLHLNSGFSPQAGIEILLDSVYGLVHWAGVDAQLAWALHLAVAAGVVAAVVVVWAKPVPYPLKAAMLCLGSLLVTPYVLRYDLCILSIAVAFLVRDGLSCGFLAGERMVILVCFGTLFSIAPPTGSIIDAALLALVIRRIVSCGAGRFPTAALALSSTVTGASEGEWRQASRALL